MARWFDYVIIRLPAHAARGERLNVAIAVFADSLDVRVARRLDKVSAISGAIDKNILREELSLLAEVDERFTNAEQSPASRVLRLARLTSFEFSSVGKFEAASMPIYEQQLDRLLTTLVEPEPAPSRISIRRTKLFSSVKSEFRKRRVLAKQGDDITSHRIMLNWRLDEGLAADMVLKNGSMHVAETVDASSADISIKRIIQDIAVAALVLEKARMTYGHAEVKGRIIYDASSQIETLAGPSLQTAAHQGAELVNWASGIDRRRFIEEISLLAHPIPTAKKGNYNPINASIHPRFDIN